LVVLPLLGLIEKPLPLPHSITEAVLAKNNARAPTVAPAVVKSS